MKKLSISLLAALLLLSTGICSTACTSDSSKDNNGIAGTYINQGDAAEFIKLTEDGTFHAEAGGMEFNGEWEVEGSEITLYWDDSSAILTIEGNTLIESDSTVWIKQLNGSQTATYKSSDIGVDGGVLEVTTSDGTTCSLTIQPGVLTETTNIKITAESFSSGSSLGALSNDFLLEPEGLEFDTPVTVAITVPNPLPTDQVPAILHTSANGARIMLETQVDDQTLSATLDHFSYLSPVDPTPFENETEWEIIKQEIDTEGLDVERAQEVAGIFIYALNARDENEEYGFYLSAWEDELRAYITDLIAMGSLKCSSGDCEEAVYILEALGKRPIRSILVNFFPDLKAEAEQALQNCLQHCQQLTGNSFPKIYYRLSEAMGYVEVFINDVLAMKGFNDPFGIYNDQQKQVPEGTSYLLWGQNGLVLTFKFLVRPYDERPWETPSGYFEVEVDGQIVFSEQLTAASNNDTLEETLTLTFPELTPP